MQQTKEISRTRGRKPAVNREIRLPCRGRHSIVYPPLEDWHRQRLEEARQGQRNIVAVKASLRHVERFLSVVATERGIGPNPEKEHSALARLASGRAPSQNGDDSTLTDVLRTGGIELAQEHLNRLHSAGLPSTPTIAANIRRFFSFLRPMIPQLDPALIKTPGIAFEIVHPAIRDWEATLGKHGHYKHIVSQYLRFLAEHRGRDIDLREETAAYRALMAVASQGSGNKMASSGGGSSIIERVCADAQDLSQRFADKLGQEKGATRESVTQRLTGLRSFYRWAREQGLTDFDPDVIRNPLNKEIIFVPHPAVDMWLEQDNVLETTRGNHSYTVRRFFDLVARHTGIPNDFEVEKAALDGLLAADSPGVAVKRVSGTNIEAFVSRPDHYCGCFLREHERVKTPAFALASYLSHLRRFLDWAYQVELIEHVPDLRTPRTVITQINRRRKKQKPATQSPSKKDQAFLVWKRLHQESKPRRGIIGPHPAGGERRVVPELARLPHVVAARNGAIEALLRDHVLSFSQLAQLRCWQVRLDRKRVALLDSQGRVAWRALGEEAYGAVCDYLRQLSSCLSCAKLWRRRGWNAPFFVSMDAGPLTVDDSLWQASGARKEALEMFVSLRDQCLDAYVGRQKLSLARVCSLTGPVKCSSQVAVMGCESQLVVALRYSRDVALFERYLKHRESLFGVVDPNSFVFPAADGLSLMADYSRGIFPRPASGVRK